jgi:hypothetical protein
MIEVRAQGPTSPAARGAWINPPDGLDLFDPDQRCLSHTTRCFGSQGRETDPMSMDTLMLAAIVGAFAIFAATLYWADVQTHNMHR